LRKFASACMPVMVRLGSSSIVRFKGARNNSAAPAAGSSRAGAVSAGAPLYRTLSNQAKKQFAGPLHQQRQQSAGAAVVATSGIPASLARNGSSAGVGRVQGHGCGSGSSRPLGGATAGRAGAASGGRPVRPRGVAVSRGKRARVAVVGLAAAGGRLELHYKPVNFVLQPAYQVSDHGHNSALPAGMVLALQDRDWQCMCCACC
jgi:hypothetical protein